MRTVTPFLVMALAIAAASFTVARGRIFASLRRRVALRSQRLGDLISCPYCTSHYFAALTVLVFRPGLLPGWAGLIAQAFALVALSAMAIRVWTSTDSTDIDVVEALEAARELLGKGGAHE